MERLKVKILCGKWCKVCACNVSLGERVFICCPYKLDTFNLWAFVLYDFVIVSSLW